LLRRLRDKKEYGKIKPQNRKQTMPSADYVSTGGGRKRGGSGVGENRASIGHHQPRSGGET